MNFRLTTQRVLKSELQRLHFILKPRFSRQSIFALDNLSCHKCYDFARLELEKAVKGEGDKD